MPPKIITDTYIKYFTAVEESSARTNNENPPDDHNNIDMVKVGSCWCILTKSQPDIV